MARWLLAILLLALAPQSVALDELGVLAEAQRKHPAVFIPGNVLRYTLADTPGYLFNGEAEQDFSGDLSESDSELYREALADAKVNLSAFFAQKVPGKTLTLRAVRTLYAFPEGKLRRVVCFVAEGDISFSEPTPPETLPPPKPSPQPKENHEEANPACFAH